MKHTRTPLFRRAIAGIALFALLFTLAPPVEIAHATVTVATQPDDFSNLFPQGIEASSSTDIAVAYFEISANDSETLSTVAVQLYDSNNTTLANSDLNAIKLWQDDGDSTFEAGEDTVLATCAHSAGKIPAFGSRTSTTVISGNTCDGTTALAAAIPTITTRYFITISTSGTWNDNGANQMWNPDAADAVTINMATDAIVTSAETLATDILTGVRKYFADTTAPQIGEAFVPSYVTDGLTVEVFFSEMLQKTAIECGTGKTITDCSTLYTMADSGAVSAAAVMGGCTDCTDADMVQLTLVSAATNGTTTITLANGLTDDAGNAVSGASAVTLEMNFPPFVKGIRKIDNDNLRLRFSKAMQTGTGIGGAQAAGAYTLTINDSAVTGSTLTMATNDIEVNFEKTGAFTAAGTGADDYIQVENRWDDAGTPMDADGMKLQGNGYFIVDAIQPQVIGGTKDIDNKFVYIRFDEMLDMDTTNATSSYVSDPVVVFDTAELLWYDPQSSPSWMTPEMGNKVVKLTSSVSISDITSVVVSDSVIKDSAGNTVDTSNKTAAFSAGATSAIAISDDGIGATRTNGSWNMQLDGCNDPPSTDFGGTGFTCNDNATSNFRDAIYIPFTGAIDTAALGESASGAVIPNIGSFVEIYDQWTYSGSSQADCGGGDIYIEGTGCVNRTYADLSESFGVIIDEEDTNYSVDTNTAANDVLVVYLKGWVNMWDNMQVNPFGIKGLNGLTATQNSTAAKNQLPQPIFAEVEFAITDVTQGSDNAAIDASDTVTLFFSADMQRTDVDDITELANKITPQRMFPWEQHSWGGTPAVAWGNYTGTTCTIAVNNTDLPDCLKITLGSSPTVEDGDEIMINGLNSLAGMPIGWGGKVDITAPTVSATLNTTDDTVTIVFSEEMVENDSDGGSDYSNNIAYDGSTGNPNTTNAAIDTTYSSDGFTNGIKLLTDSTVGGTTTWDDMWVPIRKFKLKLTLDPEAGDTITLTNLIDQGGNALGDTTIQPSSDATPPTIYKVIQNDWNGDGSLNAWDEVIFIFDGSATTGLQASDVDYSTITNPNTDFIVKRSDVVVTNAFGDGANFWVDQWDIHVGELHINLGQGADIQAGDTIWAAVGAVTDLSGNAMQSDTAQITLTSVQAGEISKIVYTDTTTTGVVDNGDTFAVYFNTPIEPTSCGMYDGTSGVTNLDWCLPLDHNFDMGGTYTYGFKTWGSATGVWDADFDVLTITLDCSAGSNATACESDAAGDAQIANNDMVQTWSLITADGGRVNKPGMIDVSKPTLTSAKGNKTFGVSSTVWDAGDKMLFAFSEPMDDTTVRTDTATNAMTDLGIANGNFGTDATLTWSNDKTFLEVTVGATSLDLDADGLGGDDTEFDPTNDVKDLNGNIDNTASAVALTESSIQTVSNMSVADADTTYSGIDGRDLTVSWTAATGADKYLIYFVPEFVRLDLATPTHYPIGIPTAAEAQCDSDTSCEWTASSSLMVDSRSTDASGNYDSSKPYFPLNEWDNYDVFIVASNTAGDDTAPPAKSSAVTRFTMEYGSDGQAPWIEGSMPWDGARDIPTNSKNFSIKFNEAMSRSSIEDISGGYAITLQKKGSASDWSDGDDTSIYLSYDETNFAAKIEPVSDLTANSEYRVIISTNVTDQGGTPISTTFYTHFSTSGTSDTIGPKVDTYFFDGATSTTNIPRNTFAISVAFNEDMDPSTFTDSSVTLTPSVAGSNIWYDPFMRSLNYVLGDPLAQNTNYMLTLSGVYLKDASGNTLDGDGNGTAAASTTDNYTLSFTTVDAALSTANPTIYWVDSDSKSIWMGFSERMDKATVESKTNWTLKRGSTVIDLQTATLFYDGFMNELRIEGVQLTAGESHTLTPSSAVVAMTGQDINTGGSSLTFTPWNPETDHYNSTDIGATTFDGMDGTFDGDIFSKMGDDNVAMDIDFKMFMPISVWPMNQTEGKTTNYHINFPISQAIVNGGSIVLEFPSSFNVTSAALAKDSSNTLYFFNQDINGPGGTMTAGSTFNSGGKVQITSVSANNQTKKITLTIAVDDGTGCVLDNSTDDETPVTTGIEDNTSNTIYGQFKSTCTDTNQTSETMPYDFLDFELSGIINGDAAEIDWFNNTGGYQVGITTKNAVGLTLEGPIKSGKFDIKKAGNGSVSGKVFTPDGVTGLANVPVWLDSPMAGHQETTTDASGNYNFSGLPVAASANAWDGWYHVMVEAAGDSDYTGHQHFDLQLTTSSPTSIGNNVTFGSANNTINFRITHTGDTLDGKDVMIWAAGSNGWKEKKVTLDADGITDTTIKVSDGGWDFGVHEYFEMTMFGSGMMEQDFMPPSPERREVTGDIAAGSLVFALTTADKTISGVVSDGTSGLANVHVFAHNPSGMGGTGTETASDGSYSLKVVSGTYSVGAHKPGLPSIPEQTVTVGASDITGTNFTLVKSGSSISGRVSDGTNSIPYTSINAWTDDGHNAWASTDQQGDYTIFLGDGTWNVEAFAPGFGRITLASGVTDASNISSSDNMQAAVVVNNDATTGLNFSVASATYYTISGQILDSSNNAVANAFVWADEVNSSTGMFVGNGNDTKTDSSGNFTIKVKANLSSTRYQLGAWHPDYGDIQPNSSTLINVASANSTGNSFTVAASYTLTVSITNGGELEVAGDSNDIKEAFIDIFSMNNNIGNHKRLKDIELTSGSNTSAGTVVVQQGNGYQARMHIPGIGEFTGTLNNSSNFSITGNSIITFDLGFSGSGSVLTFAGNVKDGSANNVENVWVTAMNTSTFSVFDTTTNSSGNFSIKVPDGTYKIRADKPAYKGAESASLTATDESIVFTITAADSTITGKIYDTDGTTAITNAFVWAEESSGDGWVGAEVDSNGDFSLAVPSDTNWNLFSQNETGKRGAITTASAAGSNAKNITLSSTVAGANFISDAPRTAPITPSSGGVIDDSDNTGVKITLPANALGTGDNSGNVTAKETASLPSTTNFETFGGIGKEITATDSNGSPITTLNSDVSLDFTFTKERVESFAGASDAAAQNGLEELDDLQNSYWDATAQNWVALSTTSMAYVKDDSADADWTAMDFDTFFTNVTGEGDNSANGGGTGKDYYDEYEVILTSTVDHFTVFGTITGSDGTPPATPATPTATAANCSVSLDWADNSEGDLLEYQIFRGTESGFTCDNSSQINTSSVTVSTYTDSTPPANTSYTYYYKLKAVDTSGNISASCSSAVSASYTYTDSSSSSSSGGGGGGGSSVDTTTPYKLPTTVSGSTVSIYRPLDLSQTGGNFARPVKLYSYYSTKLAAKITQNTRATTSNGAGYAGSIAAPKTVSTSSISNSIAGKTVHAAFSVGSSSEQIHFDKPVELTIPLTLNGTADVSKIRVFYYNSASNSYKLAGDGGTVSSDQKSITVEVNHFSTFAVIESDADEVNSSGAATTISALTDIAGQWFTPFIEKLISWGAVAGYPDGTFKPSNSTNRAEMAKIIAEAFDLTIPSLTENPFPDVPKNEWFAPFVAAVKNAGIVSGYSDGTFRPGNSINRAEALKMAIAATGQSAPASSVEQFSDVPTNAWYARFVALAKTNSIVSGSPATRRVAAQGSKLFTPAFSDYYSLGLTGDGVRNLKLVLQQLGYFDGTINENYDADAVEAVRSYQTSAGISSVGSFGPVTRRSLNYKIATENIRIPESGDLVETTVYLFRPADPVNRAEIAKIVVQAKEAF